MVLVVRRCILYKHRKQEAGWCGAGEWMGGDGLSVTVPSRRK